MNNQTQKKLLIVEDVVYLRELLAEDLRKRGYEVLEASDGPTGMKIIKNEIPDLIILDLCLEPRGMDEGYYLLIQKTKTEKDSINELPVIIISGTHSQSELENYKNNIPNIIEVFKKPITSEKLFQVIMKIFN